MAPVEYRLPAVKKVDPTYARLCLHHFVDAARDLVAAWHPDLERPPIPGYLPPFETFVLDLLEWCEEVDDHAGLDDLAFQAVDLSDPKARRAWMIALRTQLDDVMAAGEDATRPTDRRSLGLPTARRTLLEAQRAIQLLLEAADPGPEIPSLG